MLFFQKNFPYSFSFVCVSLICAVMPAQFLFVATAGCFWVFCTTPFFIKTLHFSALQNY